MVPHDKTRVCVHQLHACHPRITIRIDEVNVPLYKNVLIIRAPRRNDERGENCDFKTEQRKTSDPLHRIDDCKSPIENRKLKMDPAGFEPWTKGLSVPWSAAQLQAQSWYG